MGLRGKIKKEEKTKKEEYKKDEEGKKKEIEEKDGEVEEKKPEEKAKKPEEKKEEYTEKILCTCPLCGSDIDAETPVCPVCDAIFEENIYECPFCGGTILRGVTICSHCNAVIVSEVQKLKNGYSYLIKEEKPEKGFEIFVKNMKIGKKGECITVTYPEKIKERYNLRKTPIHWLTSSSGGEDALSPNRPDFELSHTIYEFLNKHEGGILLLHGLEQILLESGFDTTLSFLRSVSDMVSKKKGILLAPLNPNVVHPHQLATLQTMFDEIIEGEYEEKPTPVIQSMTVTIPEKEMPEMGVSPGSGPGGVSAGGGAGGLGGIPSPKGEYKEIKKELKTGRILFPFAAIIGQDVMKRSLLLNAINPLIGGVLIQGHRGTAKSVAVRGLTELLPEIEAVDGCRFHCDPKVPKNYCWECKEREKKGPLPVKKTRVKVVDIPLNATEDRVVGSLDIERVMKEGLKAFEEGLLADANRGILYVDEINLLDDYVVDVLLDAAAMGICTVERETVSVSYPANFILVGTMNPEEGKLRPQLLDRMALMVEVKGLENPDDRIKIIDMQREFTKNPIKFRENFESKQEELRKKIRNAQLLLLEIESPEDICEVIANVALAFKVDGHRADIMMQRTAQTNTAFEGRKRITKEDIIMAGNMVLPHRMRKGPLDEETFNPKHLEDLINSMM